MFPFKQSLFLIINSVSFSMQIRNFLSHETELQPNNMNTKGDTN